MLARVQPRKCTLSRTTSKAPLASYQLRHTTTARPEAAKTSQPSAHVLMLYRKLVRTAVHFPIKDMRSKLVWNIREVFELRKSESDRNSLQSYFKDGVSHLKLLQNLSKLDRQHLDALFDNNLDPSLVPILQQKQQQQVQNQQQSEEQQQQDQQPSQRPANASLEQRTAQKKPQRSKQPELD